MKKAFLTIWLLVFVAVSLGAVGELWVDGKQIVTADSMSADSIETSGNVTLSGGGAVVTTSNGDIQMLPNGTGITKVGDAGSTSHSLNSNDDFFISGELEVDGISFFDTNALFANNTGFMDAAYTVRFVLRNTAQTPDAIYIGAPNSYSNNIIIAENGDSSTDFAHAQQTNPTTFWQSADATDVTQWGSASHDQTDFKLGSGKGGLIMEHGAPVSLDDDASFDLPDASAGFGTFIAGDGEEYAVVSWTSAGVVTLQDNTANVAATDSDTDFCFFDNGTAVRVRNRLGSTKTVTFNYNYTTP